MISISSDLCDLVFNGNDDVLFFDHKYNRVDMDQASKQCYSVQLTSAKAKHNASKKIKHVYVGDVDRRCDR